MDDDDRLVPDLPAHDEYLERGVLGTILAQPDRERSAALLNDLDFLTPDDFWREQHRTVYVAVRRVAHQGDGACLIGDLFGLKSPLPGMASYELTGVVESLDAGIVRAAALGLADLGLERMALERYRCTTPLQVSALGVKVAARRERIAAARSGAPAAPAYDPLAEALRG